MEKVWTVGCVAESMILASAVTMPAAHWPRLTRAHYCGAACVRRAWSTGGEGGEEAGDAHSRGGLPVESEATVKACSVSLSTDADVA